MKVTCPKCGEVFTVTFPKKPSVPIVPWWQGYTRTCEGCGKTFKLKKASDARIYCSRSCQRRAAYQRKKGD